jgi:DNA-binding transcriptional MerR regulator
MSGWIKIHRKFLDWEWFNKSEAVHLFMYMLLKANHKDGKWQGIEVKRGQFISSLGNISNATGISIQTIRTILKKLEKTNEIELKSTSQFTIVTICKYECYQDQEEDTNKQITNNQQTTNKQLTTNKNDKNKEEYNIPIRKQEFALKLASFVELYGKEMIREFYEYWTEHGEHDKKMRFEKQSSFNIELRLRRWNKNVQERNKQKVNLPTEIWEG